MLYGEIIICIAVVNLQHPGGREQRHADDDSTRVQWRGGGGEREVGGGGGGDQVPQSHLGGALPLLSAGALVRHARGDRKVGGAHGDKFGLRLGRVDLVVFVPLSARFCSC